MPGMPQLKPRSQRQALSRSEAMSRIRSRGTTPERRVCAALHALGLRFRKNARDLPGKPDICNRRRKWVVLVHGCFWHSHEGCRLASSPKSNGAYWAPKLAGNAARDKRARRALSALGYQTFVIWECEARDAERLHKCVSWIYRELHQK